MQTQNVLDSLYDMLQEKFDYRLDDHEIKKTRKKLMKMTDNPEAENAILDYGIAYEKAGFRNGFRIAAQIFSECLCTGKITETI